MRLVWLGILARAFLIAPFALGVVACGEPPDAAGGNMDQVAEGTPLYLVHCAKCHGPAGGGMGTAPPVVGVRALHLDPPANARVRTMQFHTAKDVLDFISAKMPEDAPGTLSATQYADILAVDLEANGIELYGLRVNDANADTFVLHLHR